MIQISAINYNSKIIVKNIFSPFAKLMCTQNCEGITSSLKKKSFISKKFCSIQFSELLFLGIIPVTSFLSSLRGRRNLQVEEDVPSNGRWFDLNSNVGAVMYLHFDNTFKRDRNKTKPDCVETFSYTWKSLPVGITLKVHPRDRHFPGGISG